MITKEQIDTVINWANGGWRSDPSARKSYSHLCLRFVYEAFQKIGISQANQGNWKNCSVGTNFTVLDESCGESVVSTQVRDNPLKDTPVNQIPRGALIFYGCEDGYKCIGHIGIFDIDKSQNNPYRVCDARSDDTLCRGFDRNNSGMTTDYCINPNGNQQDSCTLYYKGWSFWKGYTLYSETPTGTLNVDGLLDGIQLGNTENFGTFDVYINGSREADDVTDYWNSGLEEGSTYEINDIRAIDGKIYKGLSPLKGTITAENRTDVNLIFDSLGYLNVSPALYNKEGYELISSTEGHCTFDVYINGSLVSDDTISYSGYLEGGSIYSITDIKEFDGYLYKGITDDSASINGTLTAGNRTDVRLKFMPAGTLNVDGLLDGIQLGGTDNYGTFDVYINGSLDADDVIDYWNSGLEAGASYEITDITPLNGKIYAGLSDGSAPLIGTVKEGKTPTSVNLRFDSENEDQNNRKGIDGETQSLYDHCQIEKQGFRVMLRGSINISYGTKLNKYTGLPIQLRPDMDQKSETFAFMTRKCVNETCDQVEDTSAYVYSLSTISSGIQNNRGIISNGLGTISLFNMNISPMSIGNIMLVVSEPGTYVVYAFTRNGDRNSLTPSFYERIFITIDESENCIIPSEKNGTCGTNIAYSIENNTIVFSKADAKSEAIWSNECRDIFHNDSNITKVDIKDHIKASEGKNLFRKCQFIEEMNLEKLDVSNVTDMSWMFYDCSSLNKLNISGWDMTNVMDMSSMFEGCTSLPTVDVSTWNTSNVTDMTGMFRLCSSLNNLDVSRWNTSKVTSMGTMFNSCTSLTSLDVSNWDTSNVTAMYTMFNNCTSLTNLDVSKWDTSNVTIMSYMFWKCSSLKTINVRNWNTSNVQGNSHMFEDSSSLTELDLNNWDTSNSDMNYLLNDLNSLQRITLGRNFVFRNTESVFGGTTAKSWKYAVKDASVTNDDVPIGIVYTTDELEKAFNASTMAGIWVVPGSSADQDSQNDPDIHNLYYTFSIETEEKNEEPEIGISKGNGQNHLIGSGISSVFTIKRTDNDEQTYDLFRGIRTDGEDVDQRFWKAEKGSVRVTLFSEYLDTLSTGDHVFTAVFEDGTHDINFSVSEPFIVPVKITSICSDGSYYMPEDLKDKKLPLTITITGAGISSKAENIELDLIFLQGNRDMTVDILFDQEIKNFSNDHKVTISNYPHTIDADIFVENGNVPKYQLKIEGAAGQIEKNKFGINIFLIWNDLDNGWKPEIIAVYALPEDEIGAYAEGPDGTREYLIFQTYDICMNYLGNEELCIGNERCYHK